MPRGVHNTPRGPKPGPAHTLKSLRLDDRLWAALAKEARRRSDLGEETSVNQLIREYCELGLGGERSWWTPPETTGQKRNAPGSRTTAASASS